MHVKVTSIGVPDIAGLSDYEQNALFSTILANILVCKKKES